MLRDPLENQNLSADQVRQTKAFHGHWCQGLAVGIRAAEWALREMGRAADEEIVAVVETDMCGVDAIQFLTGCTLGKGNLIHRDWGKNAFSFYRRRDGKAARLVARPEIFGEERHLLRGYIDKMQQGVLTEAEERTWEHLREEVSRRIMEAEFSSLFEVKLPSYPEPAKASILNSLTCCRCGEQVLKSRQIECRGEIYCIPCFQKEQSGSLASGSSLRLVNPQLH
jgi:formylmethanofuran dehydrogenase subunit E